jgi:hypothetical protein
MFDVFVLICLSWVKGYHEGHALIWVFCTGGLGKIEEFRDSHVAIRVLLHCWCRTEFNNIFGANENRRVAKNNIEAEPFD